ncbi:MULTISPECIES: TrbC/VirB2 family protein [Halomonas]|jgi:type IV secretory pathway VirB2 component (pilin)|uniref:TrbC/VirB2 family protein n=1 Tax=Halomonadaceae TaxID=28256 RepID=UPI001E5B4494|nr:MULTISPECIES: TrbC/VirB2 family protein [Halomonas]MCD1652191.1 TrbC/VirB2 family protein [Halomonas axialensis]MCD2088653.1 TrbC/VirB2 family protein [Halomonas meridiana]MCO7243521.1 TrbC/VirB2 family protein [Halomonas sp. Ps84H-12]|tara:strand:- start:114 stop:482 length:369 start_codon:yes stop_codon:yes gene_type:complete
MTTSVEIRDTKPSKFAQLRESLTTNKKRIGERSLLVATTLFMAMPAWAQTAGGGDFQDFADKVEDLAHGPFGIGISILALIIGCLVGLGRQSAAPAFLGLGIAGAFAVGPFMIKEIFSWFGN